MNLKRLKNFSLFTQDLQLKNYLRKEYLNNQAIRSTRVDIIMPTFNRKDLLTHAIASIENQLHQNWSLYICDDGSTDNTLDYCSQFADSTKIHYKKLPHRGVSATRNYGLCCTNSKYIFFLDSDNRWLPEYISLMLTFMHIFSLDSAYCAARFIGDNDERWLGDFFSWQNCAEKNYIDLNCFAIHSKNIKFLFDEGLDRFVDWDFILNNTRESRTSYLPLALVEYCNKRSRDRISTTVYQDNQRLKVIQSIKDKHFSLMGSHENSDARLEA